MDVTDKQSILEGKKIIEQNDGRLHILVNKYVNRSKITILYLMHSRSAGQVGPVSEFMRADASDAPERKDAESLGMGLFNNESFEEWGNHYNINCFSIFFMTSAFLGLLAKGSSELPGYTASVINTTSISGITKLAQRHVRSPPYRAVS
jgi:NAD(P)-dependent dehydrogenase (short-subunit alcohol dehydrogenase family)